MITPPPRRINVFWKTQLQPLQIFAKLAERSKFVTIYKEENRVTENSSEKKKSRNVYIQPLLYDAYYGERKSDK